MLGLTFHDADGARTGILHYRYDVFDRRIARFEDLDGVAGIEEREFYIHDSAPGKGGLDDIVLTFDVNRDVIHRYLHGPGIANSPLPLNVRADRLANPEASVGEALPFSSLEM